MVTPAIGLPEVRRARFAVSAMFFINGMIFANVLPRYPEIKAGLELSNAGLGTAIAAHPVGALVAGLFAGWLVSRFGSARVSVIGTLILTLAFWSVSFAGSWPALAGLLFVFGMLDAVIDIGSNSHGLRVQRHLGRSIINSLHGIWSVGAVAGGLISTGAIALGVPIRIHFGVVAAVFFVVTLVCSRLMLPGPDRSPRTASTTAAPVHATKGRISILIGLGCVAIVGAMIEDIGNSWGALWVTEGLGAPAALGGSGFVVMMSAIMIGRFIGDPAVERFGPRAVTRTSALLGCVGLSLTVIVPSLATTYVGFAMAGLGAAVLIPMAMHAADEVEGLPAGVGLAVVGWITRVGLFVSPPVVGIIADTAGLRYGLAVAPVVAIAGFFLARLMPGRPQATAIRG